MTSKRIDKTFALNDLKTIQNHFHALIIELSKQDNYTDLPEISNETNEIHKTYDIIGMEAYFSYRLTERNGKPLIKACYIPENKWRHDYEITTDGYFYIKINLPLSSMRSMKTYYNTGDIMTTEQWAIYDNLALSGQREEATLYWKKCEEENRTYEHRAYLEQLRLTAMAVNLWYLSQ